MVNNVLKIKSLIRWFCGMLFFCVAVHNAKASGTLFSEGGIIELWAKDALVKGGLRIDHAGTEEATIHGWNSIHQSVYWKTAIKKGNYAVILRCSQPREGSAVAFTIGNQQISALVVPTGSWNTFRERTIGIIDIEKSGVVNIKLKGIQLALDNAVNGRLVNKEAFPDLKVVLLVPTRKRPTSEPTDILEKFSGRSIFDGEKFTGWEGNNGKESMNCFRIERNAIVAGHLDRDLRRNEFLRTKRKYKDFELRLKYKVVASDEGYNGGVQFRSEQQTQKDNEFEMIGYQADINSWKIGALYDEQRRWDFLGTPAASNNLHYDASRWNDYIIRCEGPHIRIWLNGILTLDYIEPFWRNPESKVGVIPLKGFIALQIHSGKGCEIWYKDILLQKL